MMASVRIRQFCEADKTDVIKLLHEAAFSQIKPGFFATLKSFNFQFSALTFAAIAFCSWECHWITCVIIVCAPVIIALLGHLSIALYYIYGPPLYDLQYIPYLYSPAKFGNFWVAVVDGNQAHLEARDLKHANDLAAPKTSRRDEIVVGTISVIDLVDFDVIQDSIHQFRSSMNYQRKAQQSLSKSNGINCNSLITSAERATHTVEINSNSICNEKSLGQSMILPNTEIKRNYAIDGTIANASYRQNTMCDKVLDGKQGGIVSDSNTHNACRGHTARLRRVAVSTSYRRLGIASRLIETAVYFCREKGYDCIELITTEVHASARKLYERSGFECVAYKPYPYLCGCVHIWTYEYQKRFK